MKEIDVTIIGSGGGGAPLAYELSKKNKNVLIIDRGPVVNPEHLGNFWQTVIFNGYYHRMAAFSRSKEGIVIYRTYNIGGTTVFSCGNIVRSLQSEFLSYGIDLENAFQEAEQEMGSRILPDKQIVTGTKAIMKSSKRLGYNMRNMPKGLNSDMVCDLCGDCVLGCKSGRKTDVRPYINKAIENGAVLMPSTEIDKVLFTGNGQVRGVKLSSGREIESKIVVLSAGGLGTPVILQKSNISAGNGLFVDLFNTTYGVTDNLSQLEGPSMGTVITDFHEKEGFILSPYIDHWSQLMLFCPVWWNMIHRFPRKRTIGIMTKITDERCGKVSVDSISKIPTKQDKHRLKAGSAVAKEILKEAGARSIITVKRIRSAHPGGTVAVGEVVNSDLQVKGTTGLYVCDCSVFPVAPGLPPILTIVALAKWLGKRLA